MQIPQRVKMSVDITMTILSIILMGGTMMFPTDIVHEVLGSCLLALWILHTVFNHRWYASLFKGKYPPYRIMQIVVNIGIALCALCLMYSGITMALMLPGMGLAQSIHLVSSHWFYIFMCAHIGMHLGMIFSKIKSARKGQTESKAKKNHFPRDFRPRLRLRNLRVHNPRNLEISFLKPAVFLLRFGAWLHSLRAGLSFDSNSDCGGFVFAWEIFAENKTKLTSREYCFIF